MGAIVLWLLWCVFWAVLGAFVDLGIFPKARKIEADFEQHKINHRREEKEEDKKIHSIAWDVKTREVQEIKYTNVYE